MDSLYFGVQKVNCLEKLKDGSLDETLIEAAALREDGIHISEAHLRDLENKSGVRPLGSDNLK